MPAPDGFTCQVLTNNALVLTVLPGTVFIGGNQSITTPTVNLTLTASTTTYVYFNPQTALVATSTSGFPAGVLPIAVVTTGAAAITFIQDVRAVYTSVPGTGTIFYSTTGVITTCNSTVQNITTFALPAGILNYAGKALRLKAWGLLNTTSASGLQVGIQLAGTNACLINTANISTSLTNQPWATEMMLQVANTGVNGNVYGHGMLVTTNLTSNGAAVTSIYTQDIGTAVSANINLTGTLTMGVIGLTNGAITNLLAQILTLEILN